MLLPLALLLLGSAQDSSSPADSKAWLDRGVEAYRKAQYQEAIRAFERATSLEPANVTAQLNLATACMMLYIPGAVTPENLASFRRAEAEFQRTLALDPNNLVALTSLGTLNFMSRKFPEARTWFQKAIAVDPGNTGAHHSLGVIAWSEWYPALATARAQLGMKPEDPGPLPDPAVRQDLKSKYGPVIEEGIASLERALQLDPEYDDAMAYINLLIRERGDIRDTAEEYRQDAALADQWLQKTLETKKRKAERMGTAFPRPVPAEGSGVTGDATPQRIRIGGNVQIQKLVSRVDPVCPASAMEAKIQGSVRFTVVVGKDGRVLSTQLVSGHPLLVPAATEAVRQWVYKPTLLNGNPVEVVTEAEVNFAPAR